MTPELEELLEKLVRISSDLWTKGWAERNAGNVSVLLRGTERVKDESGPGRWRPIGTRVPDAAGERLLFTGTGTHMRTVAAAPDRDLGIIEVDESGERWRAVWGYGGGGGPTSELLPHLLAHAARARATEGRDRAVIHTHPTNLIALTYALELDTTSLTRLLWEMHTECIVVFPQGVGFIEWRLPGSMELAEATAEVLEERTMTVWQHHGIVAAGQDLDTAFGLIETAEKAAAIYIRAEAIGKVRHRLGTEQLKALAKRFGVKPDPAILG